MSKRAGAERPVLLGRLVKAQGIGGEIRVRSFAESIDSFARLKQVRLRRGDGAGELRSLERVRDHPKGVILKLAGVDDRTAAEALVGADVIVDRADLPALDEGEYYWVDLIGLAVFDPAGQKLGRVKNLFSTGANDVLVVDAPDGELLIPAVESAVTEVDVTGGRLVVGDPAAWDPGQEPA